MKKIELKLLVAASFFVFLSCDIQKQVLQIDRKVNLSEYHAIELVGSPTINLIKSNSEYIDITADERIVDYINIINTQGVLKIFIDKGVYRKKCYSNKIFANNNYCKIKINIPLDKNLNKVSLKGNGDIIFKTEFITNSNIDIFLKGNGDIYSKNLIKANTINVDLIGNGDIKLFNLIADNINSNLKGNGDIKLLNLKANTVNSRLIGNGDIILSGECNDFIVFSNRLEYIRSKNLIFSSKKITKKNGELIKIIKY